MHSFIAFQNLLHTNSLHIKFFYSYNFFDLKNFLF